MRGGYKLIDCGGKNINAVGGVVILGIFAAILAHNGKNIKLTQFCIGTNKCNDACVNCEPVNATKYKIREFYGSDYYITSDDKIERSNSELVTRTELETYVETELDNYEVLGTDILSGDEPAGKVLTSNGDGGSVWVTPETPSGGTKIYLHTIQLNTTGGGYARYRVFSTFRFPVDASNYMLFMAGISEAVMDNMVVPQNKFVLDTVPGPGTIQGFYEVKYSVSNGQLVTTLVDLYTDYTLASDTVTEL